MVTAIIFIVVIGVLVLVHEFGHFIMAKRAGMKVEEFGFGFPPRIVGWKRGETIYSINWIPFGGFVKIFGEDGEGQGPRSFASGTFWQRMGVIVAGVVMNFLLAAVLLMLVNGLGLRVGIADPHTPGVQDQRIEVLTVSPGSPADKAGLQSLDQLVGYRQDGSLIEFDSVESLQSAVNNHSGQPIVLEIKRGSETLDKTLIPRVNPPPDQGAIGISLAMTGVVSYPWYEAIWRGVVDAWILTENTVIGYWTLLKTLIVHGKLAADVSGPVGIATLTGQAARVGINYLLQFVALISVNLAVLNIVPFPALDGGRALILVIEKIKRSPVNRNAEMWVNMIGFYVLIAFMIYITYNDIAKLFVK
ncbi:MAG TPA: RIP metalloprotease RseP [Candidatus Paceibacterota bacterium]|nr:RIP metalloprotease RseP [Candidatus Paceibacterota bacterium]